MAVLTGTGADETFEHAAGDDAIDGGAGVDTLSYAAADGPVSASLAQGTATVAAAPAAALRVMPVGASLTRGLNASETVPVVENGGYRTELYRLFQESGIALDYVGSERTGGSPDLPDNQHEGVRSVEIDYFAPFIGERIELFNPDVVTLMVGTNDARGPDAAKAMIEQLGRLMDEIAGHPYRPTLIVATLPPIDPANPSNTPEAVAKIQAYNAAIPGLVAERQAAGLDVHLADMGSLTLDDISDYPADSGLHATPEGYAKMAGIWYQALDGAGALRPRPTEPGGTDALAGIENLTGGGFGDALTGDANANLLSGLGGDDTIRARDGDDRVFGGAGNDRLHGGLGDNAMDGGQGYDRSVYQGVRADFATSGTYADLRVSGAGLADALTGVEELSFEDGRLVFDAESRVADVWRLHDAAFGAPPDEAALNDALSRFPGQAPLEEVAGAFAQDPRFVAAYGGLDDQAFVSTLYADVLGRAPTAEEAQAQADALAAGETRADVLLAVADSAENVERARPAVEAGLWDRDDAFVPPTPPAQALEAGGFWPA